MQYSVICIAVSQTSLPALQLKHAGKEQLAFLLCIDKADYQRLADRWYRDGVHR